MQETHVSHPGARRGIVIVGLIAAAVLMLIALQTIQAQSIEKQPPSLDGSTKVVNAASATAGSTLQYTIVISNSGTDLDTVQMTDALPAGLDYVPGSLDVQGGGSFGEAGNVITWTGAVNNNAAIEITFDGQLDNALPVGTIITNTAEISGTTMLLERSAATTIVENANIYFPLSSDEMEDVTLVLANGPDPVGTQLRAAWELNWSTTDTTYVTGYEVQESHSPTFNQIVATFNLTGTSLDLERNYSFQSQFYYRVRAIGVWQNSSWSNVVVVNSGYFDGFDNPTPPAPWAMRRQDTDTVINNVFVSNSRLSLEMDSSYDYLIASPLQSAPDAPYRIRSRIRLFGVDNLHTYGLVFGGDWNGTTCPNNSYSSCFNHYYRLLVVWDGSNGELKYQLKRIDIHDPGDNTGQGPALIDFNEVSAMPPSESWQTWSVEVRPNGLIRVFINGTLVGEVTDPTYVNSPYFGAIAATDEYNGLEAQFDYFSVELLP